ncbi:hypothetical protein O0I10_001742 [Lichtheimia ornata]|uniref:CBM21 domain-containing protein n=1 Tax=Lichtheimia ornata TaxID=688661 RepID=A0AAD7VB52_9FUNG|nr:uncharacterized protein O0I10_001742 [Lichtheimia ornata]KAJ8662778.1 hypothetical protein O0I10_001742 [Lichtheimia ornata]
MALAPTTYSPPSMYLNALDKHHHHHHHHHVHHIHFSSLTQQAERRLQQQQQQQPHLQRRVTLLHQKPMAAAVAIQPSSTKKNEEHAVHKKKTKSVRFHEDKLEHVRLFLKTQRPLAVRAGDPKRSMPALTAKFPNWPEKVVMTRQRDDTMVRMETVQLLDQDDDEMVILTGRCRVANIAFHKRVVVRYTTDYWQSYHETEAVYREPIGASANTWDRFTFRINLEQQQQPCTVYMVLRYTVHDNEFWDNNEGLNYQVDLELAEDDDDVDEETLSNTTKVPSNKEGALQKHDNGLLNNNNNIKHQENPRQKKIVKKKLGHRYDFGASLSAAKKMEPMVKPSFANMPTTTITATPAPFVMMTATLENDDQAKYHDLVSKYCFYGNPRAATSGAAASATTAEPICG